MSASNDSGGVRSERDGHVVTITVDRAFKLNAFTPEMFEALSAALTALDEEDERVDAFAVRRRKPIRLECWR